MNHNRSLSDAPDETATAALADLVSHQAAALLDLATSLRHYAPTERLPAFRVLALAGLLLHLLADVEREAHALAQWVRPLGLEGD